MPMLSVLCLNRNHMQTLPVAMNSVLTQQDIELEIVVADGGSTDGSREYLQNLPRTRLLEGEDKSRDEGVLRSVRAARGKYIAFTTSTDGYVSPTWLSTAVNYLEQDPEAGLVWGASITMDVEGQLVARFFPKQYARRKSVPQKRSVFALWMCEQDLRSSYFSELSYVVRADIYKKLIEVDPAAPGLAEIDPVLRFHFEFLRQGYLPAYLPALANFGRAHEGRHQFSPIMKVWMAAYNQSRKEHLRDLLSGRKDHVWRDGAGREIGTMRRSSLMMAYALGKLLPPRAAHRIRQWFGL